MSNQLHEIFWIAEHEAWGGRTGLRRIILCGYLQLFVSRKLSISRKGRALRDEILKADAYVSVEYVSQRACERETVSRDKKIEKGLSTGLEAKQGQQLRLLRPQSSEKAS